MAQRRDSALTEFQRSLVIDEVYAKGELRRTRHPQNRDALRILSWNIERGHDPARIARTLLEIAPDVACLQEVDWGNTRTGSVDVLEFLARETGMLGLYAIEFLELNSPMRSARMAGGGTTGNAILTRVAPASSFRIDLPASLLWQPDGGHRDLPPAVRRRVQREPRIGARCAVGVELSWGSTQLIACSAHLEDKFGGIQGRWSQYEAALRAIETRRPSDAVGVVAGDLNTFDCRMTRLVTPDRDATALGKPGGTTEAEWWQRTLLPSTGYRDPFPSDAATLSVWPIFRAKLDWITQKGGTVGAHGVGPRSGSDHHPVWIDIELPGTTR